MLKAKVYNFVAFMNLYYGLESAYPERMDIYELISNDLNEAKERDYDWYLPFENLGDMYEKQGREEQKSKKKTELLHKAIIEYEIALKKMISNNLNNEKEKNRIKNRITISKALALYRLGGKEKDTAKDEIAKLYKYDSCYILTEVSARSLYNLACYYALASKDKCNSNFREWSAICLACSLVRDRHSFYQYRDYGLLWDHAETDQDLDNVRSRFKLETLKFELSKVLVCSPNIAKNPMLFRMAMEEVFKRAGWDFNNETMINIFKHVVDYNDKPFCMEIVS